jgi:hypothetical protein
VSKKAEKPTDLEELTKLLRDPIIARVVTVLDIAHLSILELLEYGLTRQDVNHALGSGVIKVDKQTMPQDEITSAEGLLVAGDIYFLQFLSSKVKLTELGLYLLKCVKGSYTEQEMLKKARDKFEP